MVSEAGWATNSAIRAERAPTRFGRLAACSRIDESSFSVSKPFCRYASRGRFRSSIGRPWLENAIGKLDRAAVADPSLGRHARGSVFAELPERFGRTHVAVEDLEACLLRRPEFPVNVDRAIYRALAVAYRTLGDAARSREMLAPPECEG